MSTTNVEPPTKTSSSGMNLSSIMIMFLILIAASAIVGGGVALFFNGYKESAKEGITDKITTLAVEINEVTQKNNLPGDSQITGTVQDAPTDGQIINSETNKIYLFSLPALGRSGLLYAKPYIAVTGTVDDYTITYSSESRSTTAVYESTTDSISFDDYER